MCEFQFLVHNWSKKLFTFCSLTRPPFFKLDFLSPKVLVTLPMTTNTDFNSFGLSAEIKDQLSLRGYTTPTPIQEQCIPHLVKGKDLLGIAQTGSGKTAAFSLPILQKLLVKKIEPKNNTVRCLILAPTRELASQILSNINFYGEKIAPATAVIFGGVAKSKQITALECGLDILVATPGRLLDLINGGHVNFKQLDTFVLDEADTMLDMGFLMDVKKIIKLLPKSKQTLLFSATMPKAIGELAESLLNDPHKVSITPEATAVDKIRQSVYFVDKSDKMYLLLSILERADVKSVLIFCKTKFGADRIVDNLKRSNIESAAIHSNKSQGAREKALDAFRAGDIKILAATDIAARGIDINHVTHVINFNLPEDANNYVHRIGRTARAGRDGEAITLCVISEFSLLKNVEKKIRMPIPAILDQPFHKEFTPEALAEFKGKKPTKRGKGKHSHSKKRRR